jgi:hypothetical protein
MYTGKTYPDRKSKCATCGAKNRNCIMINEWLFAANAAFGCVEVP